MFRSVFFATAAALGLMTFAPAAFALPAPGIRPYPPRPGPVPYGLQVTQVFPGGPAAQAGIERGDILVAANGVPVRDARDLRYALGRSGPVARLDVLDCRTGLLVGMTAYPQFGNIGLDGRPVPLPPTPPVPPVPPVPPWPYRMP